MSRKANKFMILLMLLAVFLSSAIGTTTVYADDGGVTGETSEPVEGETPPVEDVVPSGPVGADGASSEEQPAVPAEDQPVGEEVVTEETDPVSEILEQLPEETDVVVVDEAGEVVPLATEAAAEIIATSDPIWCKEGTNPDSSNAGDCTSGWDTVTQLVADLTSGGFTGNGTIFFTSTYNENDVILDGGTLAGLGSLTLQGGWNGSGNALWGLSGSYGLSGGTTFSAPVTIQNWIGNVFINNIEIESDVTTVSYGLGVYTTGDITLNNVNVHDTAGTGDGALLSNIGGGNVVINHSQFNQNTGGNGLAVESSGAITLNVVDAIGNGLTGASLENCLYAGGQCQGNDLVNVTDSTFNNNGFDGLVIDSGGGIILDSVEANENAVNGASLKSIDTGGLGDVTVDQSDFSDNKQGMGLDVLADGNIDLTAVTASTNTKGTGAVLDTTHGTGAVTVDTNSAFSGNNFTGLHIESGGAVDLTNVTASNNGTNGTYVEAKGDITVTDSVFNNNVHSNFPEDPGLYADSNGGNITLTNVTANDNEFGAGAVLNTNATGTVLVSGGHFNGNGTFGVQAQTKDGDLTLDGVEASLNKVKGAYLKSHGLGNIFINTSTFVENGAYGIYASSSEGNISLDQVIVTGNNVTDYGAVLSTWGGGTILVQDSAFTLNTKTGLEIVASGEVNLVKVTATDNGGNGVEVYSTYTNSCRCPDSTVVNVVVNVDGGTFADNDKYGLMVKPGPGGSLVFVNPSTFGGNGLGDYLLDLADPEECEKCGCDEPAPEKEPKEPKVVDVPFTGGDPVRLDYEDFSKTILRLPNGNSASFVYPDFEGFGKLEGLLEENLPGRLGAGTDFIGGMSISLTDEEGNLFEVNPDGTITIEFKLPEDARGRFSILYWDPTLNDGKGGWVQLPLFEEGTSFPLNPDDPEDNRIVLSGVKQIGDTITATVNFPGTFVLVSR
jgi:hypothetical protein